MGRWVQTPKGPRYQHGDGSYTYASPAGEIRDAQAALNNDFFNAAFAPGPAERFGARPAPAPQPAMGSTNAAGQFWTGPKLGYQSGATAAKHRLLGSEITGDAAFASAPPQPAAPARNPGNTAPATSAPARTAPARASSGAPSAASKGMPAAAIAPGARDLADASAQLAQLGLGRQLNASALPAFDANLRLPADSEQGMPKAMPGAWQPDPTAFQTPVDLNVNYGIDVPGFSVPGVTETAVPFDPAAAGASSDEDLAMRRRRAFLDAPDSLEGMRRARLVMADEIAGRGGDLQQFAADSKQMRPMAMQQLESYLGQLKNGSAPAAARLSGGTGMAFDPHGQAVADPPGFSYANPPTMAAGQAAATGATSAASPAFSMTAAAEQALRNRSLEAYQQAGSGTLPYQVNAQPVPGVRGETNPAALSALAARGFDASQLTPEAMRAMYGSTNALALGLGAPKPGATTKLAELTPEEVERQRRMVGLSFVTPPAGFNFYNRT
jgi:hypothetical protein